MSSLKQKIQQEAVSHEQLRQYFRGKGSIPYNKDFLMDDKNAKWVMLPVALSLVSEREDKLQKLIKTYPKTALIGWAPNPETAKAFDEWLEKLKRLFGVKLKEPKP